MQNTALSLSGTIAGQPWKRKIDLSAAHPIEGAGTLWGRARIKNLMMSLHRGADRDSVRRAVTATALRHHIVSRYTSLVATQKEVVRPADEPIFPRSVPRNLPDGWDFEKTFGHVLKTEAASLVPVAAPPVGTLEAGATRKAPSQKRAGLLQSAAASGGAPAPMAVQGPTIRLPAGSTGATLNLIVGILLLLIGLIVARRQRGSR